MKKFSLFFSLVLFIAVFQSCQKDSDPGTDQGLAPTLPPQETFIMPFTGFEDTDTTGLTGINDPVEKSGQTYRNWFYAASNVVVWNVVLAVNMALPVASFREAFNHSPVHLGDGLWEWSYDVPVNGQTYTARLTGEMIAGDQVEWIMRISLSGSFSEVVWYRGTVAEDLSAANWTVYHQANNPETFIGIDYQADASSGVGSIRYTNIIPDSPDNGDYIEYREDPTAGFNRAYDVDRGGDDFLEIQWNVPSNEGQVRNPAHFGDSNFHCWNGQLMDTDC